MDKLKKAEEADKIVPFWRQNWGELDRVFDNFRRDFERSITSFPMFGSSSLSVSPLSCDVADEGDRYVITTDMPGVSKEDIKLNVSDNTITIFGEHQEEAEEKKKNFVRKERKSFSYHRTLPLPEKIDSEKAKAKLNNGILTVEVPKVNPTPKPKSNSIPVQ